MVRNEGSRNLSETTCAVVERLRKAVDEHDLDALVSCFAENYRNETPVHPGRGFEGHEQVRSNWQRIFAGVPDIRAELLRTAVSGDLVWSEWEMRGTRRDGVAHMMRGVVIFEVAADKATSARFYLEPVDSGDDGVDGAIARAVGDPVAGPT
jgi:ketosteroid isomerase-like protein